MRTVQRRSAGTILWRAFGAVAAVLILGAVAWVPAASATPVSAGASIISTGTTTEDHTPTMVRDPGDDLSPNDQFVRTLDATRVNLSYTPDTGGSTNLVLTATIMSGGVPSARVGWDLRGTNFGSANGPCPGGISTPNRNQLVCLVGSSSSSTPVSFNPIMRASALAGDGYAFHVDVTVTDANTPGGVSASTSDVFTSAAPRFDLEKSITNSTQTPTSFVAEGQYMLKIGDSDPLGISALAPTVTFTDEVDAQSRIIRCDDTTPVTYTNAAQADPDTQYQQIVGTCNGAGFPSGTVPINQNTTGLANGQANPVAMANIDWDRIYPPPLITGNNISTSAAGWIVASMQYFMETDKVDVELGDGVANNNAGSLTVGNAIGMAGYDSNGDSGTGGSTWNPVDIQGNPNLGTDESPGEDDLTDNTATTFYNLYLESGQGKYVSELTVDGQHVVTSLVAADRGQGVSWPTQMDLCDKFDNRREHIVRAPNSTEAVVNTTAPNAAVFANAQVQYGVSAGWGPGAGPTSTQWWNMSQSGCDAADVVGGVFYTSNQIDWGNNGNGLINANDINMVRYLPSGPFLNPSGGSATYFIDVHFQVADNNDGDFIVDYSSYDPDGPAGPSTWDTSSCTGGSSGSCPDPPVLGLDQAYYRPGPVSSGVMVHVDSHPTIQKSVVGANSGTAPVTFSYELALGNTRIPGDVTPRQTFTVQDVLPPEIDYVPGSATVPSNPAGLNVSGPVLTHPGNRDILTWTISGLTLDVASADMPVIRYEGHADEYTASSGTAGYINRATITGPGILDGTTTPWSPNSQITADEFRNLSSGVSNGVDHSTWGLFAEARVQVNRSGRAIMSKDLDAPTGGVEDAFHYTLVYGNGADDVESFDAYDILPFDGDGLRGSAMHGGIELLSVAEDPDSDVDIWISDVAPASLDQLDAASPSDVAGGINPTVPGLPATGSPTWPCMIQNAGQPGCPALSAVTAIRIVGADPNPSATGGADSFLPTGTGPYTIQVGVRPVGGRGGDEFHNNWAGAFPPLGTAAIASAPVHTLSEGAVGDRVFKDANANGVFDSGDTGIANVEVKVFDASDTVVGNAQTDANGRWLVDHLRPGDYRIRIPSSEFASGGTLEGYKASDGAAPDPDADVNETDDHDARDVANGIEAGGRVSLSYGNEPLLDDLGSLTFLRDVDSNLTVDFALVEVPETPPPPPPPPPKTPPTTTTTTGVPPIVSGPPRSLPRTGWESLWWIIIGGSLVVGGTMVVSRRQDRRA